MDHPLTALATSVLGLLLLFVPFLLYGKVCQVLEALIRIETHLRSLDHYAARNADRDARAAEDGPAAGWSGR